MVAISIHDLWCGALLFAVLFAFQTLLWHWLNVPHQLLVVGALFLLGPLPFYTFGFIRFSGLVFSLLLSANYISAFPVFQASSPTLVLLEYLYRKQRASEPEILTEMLRYGLVQDRLSDLETGTLLSKSNGQFKLTLKGNLLAAFFIIFRKLLGLPEGAG